MNKADDFDFLGDQAITETSRSLKTSSGEKRKKKKSRFSRRNSDAPMLHRVNSSDYLFNMPEDDFYMTYQQKMNEKTLKYDSFEYVMDKKSNDAVSTNFINNMLNLESVPDTFLYAIILKKEAKHFNVVGSCLVPPRGHLTITNEMQTGTKVLDDIMNVDNKGRHKNKENSSIPNNKEIEEGATIIRIITLDKETNQYICKETLMPVYVNGVINVASYGETGCLSSISYGTKSDSDEKNRPPVPYLKFTDHSIIEYFGDYVFTLDSLPDPAYIKPSILVCKVHHFNKISIIHGMVCTSGATFIIDFVDEDHVTKSLDIFTISDGKVNRQGSVDSSLKEKPLPGMILIKFTKKNSDGIIQVIETLYLGSSIKNANLRITKPEEGTGRMILLGSMPIPDTPENVSKEQGEKRKRKKKNK